MTYKIELLFGSIWEEYEVTTKDFQKTEVLHKNLRMADSVCTFSFLPDITLYNKLRGISNNEVAIKITKDDQPYFYGYIRKTFNIKKTQSLEPVKIECVTPSFLLKRKVGYSLLYTNITVTQLLTNLLTTAGVTLYTLPTISAVIPGFSVVAGQGNTYHKYIDQLLFEYGYVGYFNKEGRFIAYKIQPSSITTTKIFNGSNCLTEINQIKKEEEKEKVVINWTKIETYSNKVVFSDTTNAQAGYKCYIELPPNGYLDGKEEWYAELDCPEGKVLNVSSVSHDIIKDADIQVLKFEVVGNRVLVSIKNTSTTLSRVIKKFDIIAGTVVVKKDKDQEINRSMVIKVPSTEKVEEIETEYIYSSTDGDYLANILAWYYKYSDFEYRLSSKTDYQIGDIVQVSDYGIGTITGRIINKKSIEYSQTYEYEIEAIDEYTPDTVINETVYIAPTPSGVVDSIQTVVEAGLNSDGTVRQPINSNTMVTDIDPAGDGLYLTKSYIGLMQGFQWKSFIKNDGTFSFYGDDNNYLTFSGGSLSIKGNADIAGKITATLGSIGGVSIASSKLYVGTGTFNNANTAYYLDNTGQLSLKDKLSWNGTTLTISGNITSTSGTIGGFTLGSTSLSGANFTLANTGDITLGSANSIVRLSSSDATYGLWIGNATAASAPFRITKAGVLTATGVTISGAITATSGSFTGTISTSNITATGGTVGGFTINSTTVTGGSLSLTNTGNISAGTSNDIARISADDATYRLWVGNATAASAPFRVSKAGVLTASGATISGAITATSGSFTGTISTSNITATGGTIGGMNLLSTELKSSNYVAGSTGFKIDNTGYAEFNNIDVRGNVNSTSGSVGGWLMTIDKLTSATTGSRITLDKGQSRVSIYDSTGIEKIVMGYLSGLSKNSGIGTYGSTDYGFWVKPGNTVYVDGPMSLLNGDMTASDASFKVLSGATETIRLGVDAAVNGLHLYHANGKVSISNTGSDSVRLQSEYGWATIGSQNTSWVHFYTDRPGYYFDHAVHAVGGFQVYNTGYGLDATGKAKVLSGTGTDSNTVYIEDSNGQLKERVIPAVAWTNTQAVNASSNVSFGTITGTSLTVATSYGLDSTGKAKVLSGTGTDSNTVYIKDSSLQLKERAIPAVAWTNTQAVNTTSDVQFGKLKITSGTGTDSNTVYIKDSNGQLKERALTAVAWTNTQATNTTSDVQFGKLKMTSGTGADTNTVYVKDSNGQLKERAIPAVAWTNVQDTSTNSDVTFSSVRTNSDFPYTFTGTTPLNKGVMSVYKYGNKAYAVRQQSTYVLDLVTGAVTYNTLPSDIDYLANSYQLNDYIYILARTTIAPAAWRSVVIWDLKANTFSVQHVLTDPSASSITWYGYKNKLYFIMDNKIDIVTLNGASVSVTNKIISGIQYREGTILDDKAIYFRGNSCLARVDLGTDNVTVSTNAFTNYKTQAANNKIVIIDITSSKAYVLNQETMATEATITLPTLSTSIAIKTFSYNNKIYIINGSNVEVIDLTSNTTYSAMTGELTPNVFSSYGPVIYMKDSKYVYVLTGVSSGGGFVIHEIDLETETLLKKSNTITLQVDSSLFGQMYKPIFYENRMFVFGCSGFVRVDIGLSQEGTDDEYKVVGSNNRKFKVVYHDKQSDNIKDVLTIDGDTNISPIGAMILWPTPTAPTGWLLCNGQAVSRTTYSALYAILGTEWGSGDGTTTFNVPDMRGASPAGVGTSVGYSQNETIALTTKYDDQFQGHKVETTYLRDSYGGSTGGGVNSYKSNNANTFTSTWGGIQGQTIVTDGTNGDPRIGNITRGKVVGVNFIIKY